MKPKNLISYPSARRLKVCDLPYTPNLAARPGPVRDLAFVLKEGWFCVRRVISLRRLNN